MCANNDGSGNNVPHRLCASEWSMDRSCGPCVIAAGVYLVGMQDVVGASIAELCVWGAMSPFDRVTVGLGGMQTGCEGVVGLSGRQVGGLRLARGDGGLVGQKLFTLGTGPIDLSGSVAQLNHHSLCGVTLCVV